MGIAEEGLDAEARSKAVMQGELGSVVEGHALAQAGWQGREPAREACDDGCGALYRLAREQDEAGLALVGEQEVLALLREGHEVGFPMACDAARVDGGGPFLDGYAVLEGLDG
jgi:hypothetical protein